MITNTEKINFFTVCFGEAIINNDGVNVAAKCPKCNEKTVSAHPAKFSPDDKYMRYRLAERYN